MKCLRIVKLSERIKLSSWLSYQLRAVIILHESQRIDFELQAVFYNKIKFVAQREKLPEESEVWSTNHSSCFFFSECLKPNFLA